MGGLGRCEGVGGDVSGGGGTMKGGGMKQRVGEAAMYTHTHTHIHTHAALHRPQGITWQPLGWASLPLYDHHRVLATGAVLLRINEVKTHSHT